MKKEKNPELVRKKFYIMYKPQKKIVKSNQITTLFV